MPSTERRAVITGCGVVCPLGNTLPAFWDALSNQRSGVRPIQGFDVSALPMRFGGEVRDFNVQQYIDKKERKRLAIMPRPLQLGLAAAFLAVQDAALDKAQRNPDRFGVVFGGGTIPACQADLGPAAQLSAGEPGEIDLKKWGSQGMATVPPMWLLNFVPNMLACHVSILHDARGPVNTVTQTEAGGLLALGEAWRMIRRDRADIVLVGGSDSRINAISGVRQCLFSSLSRRNDEPEKACRPFDRQRDGAVLGEGGGAVLLEEVEHARRRGARILAELSGFGAALDGDRSGAGLARSMRLAFAGAKIGASDLDHVNAHGLSTRDGDAWEARGLRRGLGDTAEPVNVLAVKSFMGNLGSGSGLVEMTASLLALQKRTVPSTLNYHEYDPECPVFVPRQSWPATRNYFLKVGLTELGQCAAVVCRRWEP
jgi:3-oxoacyl-[acyl-carrier-protein] synthase II